MAFRNEDQGLAERADELRRRVERLQLELAETRERLAISEDGRSAPVHPLWRWVALAVSLAALGLAAHAAGL